MKLFKEPGDATYGYRVDGKALEQLAKDVAKLAEVADFLLNGRIALHDTPPSDNSLRDIRRRWGE